MRLALQEIVSGMELQNRLRILRGWKLFILIPRMLLFRPARGGKVPKNQLLDMLSKFVNGQWLDLLGKSQEASENAARLRSRDDVEKGVERAEALISMGEISAAHQALEGSLLAPGKQDTLDALKDENRQPPVPHDPIPEDVLRSVPERPFELEKEEFLHSLRTAHRGAAGRPSGMRTEQFAPFHRQRGGQQQVLRSGSVLCPS